MENNTYKSDGLTENVIAQILELFRTYRLFEVEEEEAKLKAICDDVLIHDTKSANEQYINLGTEFYNLKWNEMLLAF